MDTSSVKSWSVEQVGSWIEENGFSANLQAFLENDVDGETLLKLTENMVARLLPSMKLQVKFLELQKALNSAPTLPSTCVTLSLSNSTFPQSPISSPSQQCGQQLSHSTYVLPDFPMTVKHLLGTKIRCHFLPGTSNRSTIVETLVDDLIRRHMWYPSRTSYNVVVATLVTKYPFLLDADGMSLSIVELALVGEDQRSIDKNVDVIVSEWKKMHPDNRILAEKMKRTGPYRQKLCLEQSSSAVLEKFPCLQHHAFLTADALMLYEIDTTKIGNIADMEIGLSRFVERKYCRGKENDEFKTLLKNHKINMEETLENSIREDLRIKFGLHLLILCFEESAALLSIPTAQDVCDPVPCITAVDSKWSVHFDNICLISNLNSFSKAVECWFSIFFVFQVKYPSSLANTCLFIEKYLCRHSVAVPSFVKRLANKVTS